MKRTHIQKGILFGGIVISIVVTIAVYRNQEILSDLGTLLLSLGAYISVFARQFISEKLSDILGLDDNSKDIKELQKFDVEVINRLDETETQLEATEKKLEDTQELTDELLDKLNKIVEDLEHKDVIMIKKSENENE